MGEEDATERFHVLIYEKGKGDFEKVRADQQGQQRMMRPLCEAIVRGLRGHGVDNS